MKTYGGFKIKERAAAEFEKGEISFIFLSLSSQKKQAHIFHVKRLLVDEIRREEQREHFCFLSCWTN